MAEFQVKVVTTNGLQEQAVMADTAEDAVKVGSRYGRTISVKRTHRVKWLRSKWMTPSMRAEFLKKLAIMLASRVPIGEALQSMAATYDGPIGRCSVALYYQLHERNDFIEALESMPSDFPESTRALIKAGMASGPFHQAVADAAEFELEMIEARKTNSENLWVAIANFVIGAGLILGVTFVFGPRFVATPFIQQSGDLDIAWVEIMGNLMGGSVALFLLVGFLFWVAITFIRPMDASLADRAIMKVPYIRELLLNRDHFTVFYTLAKLIQSGLRLDESLNVAQKSSPDGEIRADLQRGLRELAQGHANWAKAMRTINPMDMAALATARNRHDIALSLREISRGKKSDFLNAARKLSLITVSVGYFLMAAAGFLLFAYTSIPAIQAMQNIM